MIVAVGCIALSDACAKALSERYGVAEIVFVRALVGGALLGAAAAFGGLRRRREGRARLGDWRLQALRGALATAAIGLFVWGLSAAPFANAVAVSATAPLFMALLGRGALGEPIRPAFWPALVLGAGGVLLISPPTGPVDAALPYVAILASSLCYACVSVVTRFMAETSSAVSTSAATYGVTVVASGAWLLATGPVVAPAPADLPAIAALGAAGAAGMFAYARAYAYAGVANLAPWDNMVFPWALLFGLIAFADVPDGPALLGGGLIMASGLLVSAFR